MRDMKKRSISERENYAKTLLCIHRKRNLTNIHDNQIKVVPGGKKGEITESQGRGIRTTVLDPIILRKADTIERLAATRLPLSKNLNLIEIDQLLRWRW
jgi:hypothetical protein